MFPDLIDTIGASRTPLERQFAARVLDAGYLAGLQALHSAGVIHRDVKPANVLADGSGLVCVIDLGIAADASGSMSHLTPTSDFIGTPAYAAPEQLVSSRVDARADVYAAGLTVRFLLTGQQPLRETQPARMLRERERVASLPPVAAMRRDVSPAVDAALARMLAFDPDERIATAEQAAALLTGALHVP